MSGHVEAAESRQSLKTARYPFSQQKADEFSGLVLHVCAVDFTAWQFVRPAMRAQERHGWRTAVCCGGGPWLDRLRAEGFEAHVLPVRRSLAPWSRAGELWRMFRLMRRLRPGAVHVHTPIAAWLGRLAARLAGVPRVYYTVHGFLFHDEAKPWMNVAARLAERIAAPWTDAMLFVSGEDREAALAMGLLAPERLIFCGNGVDVEALDPARWKEPARAWRREAGIPEDALAFGYVGRLVREKGLLELVEAFARARADLESLEQDAWLVLVGDALPSDRRPVREEARTLAERLGVVDRVVFAGMIPEPWAQVAAMDVFVLPSWREGMPVSLLEAMALGRACVATKVRGCREAIVPGENGLLVPPRDPARLADALARLGKRPELRERLGLAARTSAKERFSLERNAEALMGAYALDWPEEEEEGEPRAKAQRRQEIQRR